MTSAAKGQTPRIIKGRKVGVPATAHGVWVRGIKHFTECLVAAYPAERRDEECTCMDWSPD